MGIFVKKYSADLEALRGLEARYDQIVAERQSLYGIVDKLTGYCEGLEKRIETQRVAIEALEDRMTNMEVAYDRLDEVVADMIKIEEEIDETS